MNMISRRTLLGTVGAIASVAAISSCSNPNKKLPAIKSVSEAERQKALNTQTELVFWSWTKNIQKHIDLFNKKYPKIKVRLENVGDTPVIYQKLRTVLKAGQGAPDVTELEMQYVQSFTVTKSLLDLSPYGAAELKPEFVDFAWKQVHLNGGIWAVPQDSGPMGQLYRKDLYQSLGLKNGAKTWDEYYEQAKIIRRDKRAYIGSLPPNDAAVVLALLWQMDAKSFGYDGNKTIKVNLVNDQGLKLMQYWQKMVKEDLVDVAAGWTDTWFQSIARGKYLSWLTGAWAPVYLEETAANTAGKWHLDPLPQWDSSKQMSGCWGGACNAVLSTTKNPIAAYELAKFLTTNKESALKMANDQHLFPVNKAILADPQFLNAKLDFCGGQDTNRMFSEISKTINPNFPTLPYQDVVFASFDDTLGKQISSRGDLVAGLKQWQETLLEYGKKQGFTIRK